MTATKLSNKGKWRRWCRREDGTATIEFVILFPVFMVLFLSAFEIGLYMVRQVMLDRATDIAVRSLRLGQWDDPTHEKIKDYICELSMILPDCDENLRLNLSPVSETSWTYSPGSEICVDKTEEINEPTFLPGIQHEMMMMHVCALQRPLFPTTGLGLQMPRQDNDHYALISLTAFVNEPS
jgi:hypothetical protein